MGAGSLAHEGLIEVQTPAFEDVVTHPSRRASYVASGQWDDTLLVDRVLHWARSRPEEVAVVDLNGTRRRTYADLQRDASRFAQHLGHRGIGPGDVVSVQLPNQYEMVVAVLGTRQRGAVVNVFVPAYRSKEIAYILETVRPKVVVTPGVYRGFDHRQMIDGLKRSSFGDFSHVVVGATGGDEQFEEILTEPSAETWLAPVPASGVDSIIFTSGTEATPKAVMHTEQTSNFAVRTAWSSLGTTSRDVVWMPSPLGHSIGFNYGLRFSLFHGLRLVLQDQWDPHQALDLIGSERCTFTVSVPTILQDLVEASEAVNRRLPTLTAFGCGGAPVRPDLVEEAAERGIGVLRLYGSSETFVATWNRSSSPPSKRSGTDGLELDGVEVQVRDEDDQPCRPGQQGEIAVRGPNTFVGCFDDPERTEAAFAPDGFFRSGDIGVLDEEGFLSVVGRKKEIIIRGGVNIAPREIEEMVAAFPEVERVAVVGLPDARLGEQTCAAVALRSGQTLDLGVMLGRLSELGLAKFKLPERLEVIDRFPMTPSGKIQKHEIRRMILDGGSA